MLIPKMRGTATLLLLLLAPGLPFAAAQDSPKIPAYERLYREGTDLPAAGRLLLQELNCVSCHAARPDQLHLKQAPHLDEVGGRVRAKYFERLLAAPHKLKPGTTMPAVFADPPSPQQREQIRALAQFLASTGSVQEAPPIGSSVAKGEKLFHSVGCVACHDPRRTETSLSTSMPLGDLEAKYTIPSLASFLQDPLIARPSGRMPHLNLSDDEARDVASYLLRNLDVPASLTYRYYEGNWKTLPDFDKLQPKSAGPAFDFSVAPAARKDQFGLRLEGKLQVKTSGTYTFYLGSDDGSRLWIDGQPRIDVDGIHPFQMKEAKLELEAGLHEVRVDYFEAGGEEVLRAEYSGPNLKRTPLSRGLVVPATAKTSDDPLDPALVERGRELFQSTGCAACHQLRSNQRLLSNTAPPAKPLSKLQDGGCLASKVPDGLPNYHLDDAQRAALRAGLQNVRSNEPLDATRRIHQTLATFNCYACHQRGEQGGVERPRLAFFQSDQPEMGDEGRLPPTLTGVGDKLQDRWLQQVLNRGAKDRPYMHTRMPRFSAENTGDLIGLLAQSDRQTSAPALETDLPTRRLKVGGRKLAGAKGFSCIKCHTFGKSQATGIQAISLTSMHQRLRQDWFYRYMLDPQSYRKGTRMPGSWPRGQVQLPDILDGKASTQIHSVWAYLTDGERAQPPLGLQTVPLELVPIEKALIYRNFIQDAGPRAIGVGFPERVHLAFDANHVRIALLWHGAFIDASRHWTGRGQGYQPPLGENILTLPEGVSVAELADSDAPWPAAPDGNAKAKGIRFLGYRLGAKGEPTFRYQVGQVTVEDTPRPMADEAFAPLRRNLLFIAESAPDNLWYRAAVGKSIAPGKEAGEFTIDGEWHIKLAPGAHVTLRKQGERVELLQRVLFEGKRAQIVQEYHW